MIIGSVHTDLVQFVKELPKGNEAPEILKTETRVCGSGFQIGRFFREIGFPFTVICDPGESVYGEKARAEAKKYGIELAEGSGEIGGCTFTMIDRSGNQGVFCVDGSEYHFSLSRVYDINPDEYGAVALAAEMLAGDDVQDVIDLLNELELPLYLICSARTGELSSEVLEALSAFEPVMIFNDSDACSLCAQKTRRLEEAARLIQNMTRAPVMILMNDGDAFYLDGEDSWVAPSEQKADTEIWAAAFIAARMAGVDARNSMMFANENSRSYHGETMKQRLAGMILHR